jgi:hypothetical protein
MATAAAKVRITPQDSRGTPIATEPVAMRALILEDNRGSLPDPDPDLERWLDEGGNFRERTGPSRN